MSMPKPKKPHNFRCSDETIRTIFYLYRNKMPKSQIVKHTDVSAGTITSIIERLEGHPDYDFTESNLPPMPNIEEICAMRYATNWLQELQLTKTVCPQCRSEFFILKSMVNVRCTECLHQFKMKTNYRPNIQETEKRTIPEVSDIPKPAPKWDPKDLEWEDE